MEQNKEEKSKVANPIRLGEIQSLEQAKEYVARNYGYSNWSELIAGSHIVNTSVHIQEANNTLFQSLKEQRDELLKASETIINHLNKTAAALGENIYNKIMESNKVKTLDSIIAKAKGGING